MPGRTNQTDLIEWSLSEYAVRVVAPDTEVTVAWMKRTRSRRGATCLGLINGKRQD